MELPRYRLTAASMSEISEASTAFLTLFDPPVFGDTTNVIVSKGDLPGQLSALGIDVEMAKLFRLEDPEGDLNHLQLLDKAFLVVTDDYDKRLFDESAHVFLSDSVCAVCNASINDIGEWHIHSASGGELLVLPEWKRDVDGGFVFLGRIVASIYVSSIEMEF